MEEGWIVASRPYLNKAMCHPIHTLVKTLLPCLVFDDEEEANHFVDVLNHNWEAGQEDLEGPYEAWKVRIEVEKKKKEVEPIPTAAGPECPICGRGVGCWLGPDERPCGGHYD